MKKELNNNMILIMLGLMVFLVNGDSNAVTPLLGDVAASLDITVAKAAYSVIAYMLMFGVFTIFVGPLAQRYGQPKIIKIAAIGTAIFSILGGFAWNLPSLIIFRGVNGAFGAGIFPVTMAYTGILSTEENRRINLARMIMFMTLGSSLAFIIGGLLATVFTWRYVYWAYGVAEFIMAIVLTVVVPNPKTLTPATIKVSDIFKSKPIRPILLSIFLLGLSVFGAFTFSGEIAKSLHGFGSLGAGIVLTFFSFGNIIGGSLLKQFNYTKQVFIAIGCLGVLSFVMMFFFDRLVVMLAGLFIVGLTFITFQSSLIEKAQNLFEDAKSIVMSAASFAIFVGGAIGTTTYSRIGSNFSLLAIYLISGMVLAIVVVIGPQIILEAD